MVRKVDLSALNFVAEMKKEKYIDYIEMLIVDEILYNHRIYFYQIKTTYYA